MSATSLSAGASALLPPIEKYPRTPHLEGSHPQKDDGPERVPYARIRGRYIVVEEKVDGGNSGVSFSHEAEQLLQSKGHYLTGGGREIHFALLKSWAKSIEGALFDVLTDRYVMYGEWMFAKHTVFYDQLPHYFLEFDVFDRARRKFLSTSARRALLGRLPVWSVPVLYAGVAPRHPGELMAMIRPSHYKSSDWRMNLRSRVQELGLDLRRALQQTEDCDLAEGLYIKVEEGGETVERYKMVRSGFIQTIIENDSHWLSRPIIPNGMVHKSLIGLPGPVWDAGAPLLSREDFKEEVFARQNGKCAFCQADAVDAHHIIDRGLFPDGGYYLDNGIGVCYQHHIDCERGAVSTEEARLAARCNVLILPPGCDPVHTYDKRGRRVGL